MKKILHILIVLLATTTFFSQIIAKRGVVTVRKKEGRVSKVKDKFNYERVNSINAEGTPRMYIRAEKMPVYCGKLDSLTRIIKQKMKRYGIYSNEKFIVTITIEKDSTLSDITCSSRGDIRLKKLITQVLDKSGKWRAAEHKGRIVTSKMILYFEFSRTVKVNFCYTDTNKSIVSVIDRR